MEEPVEYNAGKKEERILIKKEINYHPPYGGWRGDGKEIVLTRAEAINRMAKANWIATVCAKNQCVPFDITKEQWDEEWEKLRIDYKKVYYAGAEAALNALLEE